MKDRFSTHANQYAQFRPTYPPELFEFIYKHVQHFNTVWDCGTGNGQAARELSKKFRRVFATDISASQIGKAYQAENIYYSIANEKSSLTNHSVDLIAVAQAAHWFDMHSFSKEVVRVLKPDGMIAIWGYGLLAISPDVDLLIRHFYKTVIGPYWDKERRHIDEHYVNLYFPFKEIQSPAFSIIVNWKLDDLKGYITTWSAVQKYMMEKGHNPVDALIADINNHWKEERQTINFPLFLRLGGLE